MDLEFSGLSEKDGDYPDRITQAEILSVLDNPKHRLSPLEGYPRKDCYTIACGYSSKKRILLIVSNIEKLKRKILQVKVADEEEIEHFYCTG
ncbi:hypothetical protein [Aquiflexum sp.]|uniref:hypothetical protein n=1 Tax=Aquiflexum sp. TaxID=1872584 RepID=UPI0035941A8A